jgi:hypothetical protein
MEGSSRIRSILGLGLVLIGGLLLFRALQAPMALSILPSLPANSDIKDIAQIEAQAEAQRAQIDAQRERIEAQAEAQRAQIDAQRERIEAQAEAQRAQIEAQAEAGALPALPALPPMPPVPPVPPMPPVWHIGGWLNPATVLLVLLVLVLWRRGRGERVTTQA